MMDIAYKRVSNVPFTIGCGRSFSVIILPSLVGSFKSTYPKALLEMKTFVNTRAAMEALLKKECDMTLSSVVTNTPGLIYERLMDDPFLLACPLNMDIPDEINLYQLKRIPMVMREEKSYTMDQITGALDKRGVSIDDLNVVMTVYDNGAVKQAVEVGNGCGFVPRSAVSNSKMRNLDMKLIKVKGLEINRSIYLVRREDDSLNENLKLFWAYASMGFWYKDLFAFDPK